MRAYLLAVLALACVPWPAAAQNAITQEGTALQNSPMMFRGNNRARQGAGVGGAPSGQTITTGDSVVGGRCDYSAPTDAPGGYYKLCVDAAAGKIVLDGTKAPPLGLTVEINGSTYGFPASGTGTGNVVGPNATTINEITSWSNALGTLLRSGPSAVSEKRTGAIAVTGASITGTTNDAVTADQILAYTFCTAPCLPLPAMGGGNYEGIRGVGISTAGTTVPIVAGVSGYVMANQPFVGFGPSSVALFGTGAVNVNGGSVWGVNTNVSDRQYRAAQSSTGNRRVVGAEFDVSASYPDTNVTGILVAGNSVVQPTNSTAVAVVGQDFSAPVPGSIAKWTNAYYTYPGTAVHFGVAGPKGPGAAIGQNSDAQDINMQAYIGTQGGIGQIGFGPGADAPWCASCNPATFQFMFNWGLNVSNGGLIARSGTDQVIALTGHLDVPTGAMIQSRSDNGSTLKPLEINASDIHLRAAAIFVATTVGGAATQAASCATGVNATTVRVVNGIVTAC
jgi:hypothetical protein